jgi:sugar phosphate permease
MVDPARRPGYRWVILGLGITAQAATCTFLYGLPMLVPIIRSQLGLSLFQASVVISAPATGLLLTLILWGALADRYGERLVMVTGTGLASVALFVTLAAHSTVALCLLLALAGAAGASVNAASGRVVMGWFSPKERGLAMGARQTAQPLGTALAAAVLPPLGHAHGLHVALLFPAIFCAVVSVLVVLFVLDPPRPTRGSVVPTPSPYRNSTLWRIHAGSALLVVPQFAIAAFTLVYLVGQRGWDPTAAGRMIFFFQLAGAIGRVLAGVWSDRVSSRLRPMRQLGIAVAILMAFLALCAWAGSPWIIVGFGLGAVLTVADNGLGYTAVAELAGSSWTGRALGVQNTGQNIVGVLTAPVLAAVIGESRYPLGFGLVALAALCAAPITPVRAELRARAAERDAAAASA